MCKRTIAAPVRFVSAIEAGLAFISLPASKLSEPIVLLLGVTGLRVIEGCANVNKDIARNLERRPTAFAYLSTGGSHFQKNAIVNITGLNEGGRREFGLDARTGFRQPRFGCIIDRQEAKTRGFAFLPNAATS